MTRAVGLAEGEYEVITVVGAVCVAMVGASILDS